MKIKISIILTLICVVNLYGQTYKSVLGNDTARWSIISLADWELTDEWMTNKTVSLNSVSYRSLSHYNTMGIPININEDIFWGNYNPGTLEDNTRYYLRESDDYSKLYIYDQEKMKEYLIADLNLNIGDKFYLPKDLYFYILSNQTEHLIVDSIYFKNGLKHVQLNSDNWYFDTKLTFVEGVGPNFGIFYIYGGFYMNKDVFCLQCFKNDNLFYRNNSAGRRFQSKPCYFNDVTDKVKTVQPEFYKIINNSNSIEIHFDNQSKRCFTLFDLGGRILYKQSNSENNILIPKERMKKGFYILKIENQSNMINQTIKLTF